jgi:hypothetical protein
MQTPQTMNNKTATIQVSIGCEVLALPVRTVVMAGSTKAAITAKSTALQPLHDGKYAVIRAKSPNARTDRRGRSVASELETDAARPRSVQ